MLLLAFDVLVSIVVVFFALAAAAQIMTCRGDVNGVPSQSQIQFERTPNTTYVAGVIQNTYAYYTFNGQMFGGRGAISRSSTTAPANASTGCISP